MTKSRCCLKPFRRRMTVWGRKSQSIGSDDSGPATQIPRVEREALSWEGFSVISCCKFLQLLILQLILLARFQKLWNWNRDETFCGRCGIAAVCMCQPPLDLWHVFKGTMEGYLSHLRYCAWHFEILRLVCEGCSFLMLAFKHFA